MVLAELCKNKVLFGVCAKTLGLAHQAYKYIDCLRDSWPSASCIQLLIMRFARVLTMCTDKLCTRTQGARQALTKNNAYTCGLWLTLSYSTGSA